MQPTMVEHRHARGCRPGREVRSRAVAIFVDETTKVVYQGLTGSQGRFYGLLNRGCRDPGRGRDQPPQGGQRRRRHPRLRQRPRRRGGTRRHDSQLHLHPRPWRARRRDRGPPRAVSTFIVCITEGAAGAPDQTWFFNKLPARLPPTSSSSGPNCPHIMTPGKANIGITAGHLPKAPAPGETAVQATWPPLRHAHLPGALRAEAQRHRGVDVRGDRGRSGAGHVVHRLPRGVRGRPRHPCGDDDRRSSVARPRKRPPSTWPRR